ncbi:capsule biosynthesis GfcC family protein [Spongiibacter sp. KMU-158]|uniref:Capsule biosynthesis GfcC family protein n=1 Tax=Spongiibacter pelagi TaxID=2760804 RepID=A0A927GV94_9GAMM|nr:capsule biosynthesis GfcC family protein [Spongiibacter pelagi]MBD2857838.1 capsule biosynthesis GfcC family protein [Spongiibacter pelagi]
MRFRALFVFIASLIILPSAFAQTTQVEYRFIGAGLSASAKNKASLSFVESPRLDQLVLQGLAALNLTQDQVDWLSSRMYNRDAEFTLKEQVVAGLAKRAEHACGNTQRNGIALNSTLRRTSFAQRLYAPLDPDITRLDIEKNSKIHGRVLVTFASNQSPSPIEIFGNVEHPGRYPWRSRVSARDYLKNSGNLAIAGQRVVVIQPDGVQQAHSLGRFQGDFQDIAPGALIYVPFDFCDTFTALSDRADLDQMIMNLLGSRLP